MKTGRRAALVHWLPALVWAATIFVLSSQSSLPGPPGGLTDKHGHAIAFGILTLACLFGLASGTWQRITWRMAALAATMSVAYGMSDEWHQSFVPGRISDLADIAADAVGAVGAAGLGWAWAILLRRRDRRS